jgi:glycerol kinase
MALAGLKKHQLPTIVDSFGELATITAGELSGVKVRCILGDQQSSAYAHELGLNEVKITYGTGCFLLANIGSEPAIHESLVTTILYKQGEKVQYAFECSVECGGGTLNWARRAGFFAAYAELNQLEDVTAHHLYFFPSFGEIYAPFWRSDVRGGMLGLNLSTTRPQITAAILESILFRIHDNLSAPTFASLANIYVDGGMTANPAFLQAQADLLNKKVTHRERDTCWGVAKGVLTSLSLPSTPFADQKVQLFLPNEQQGARLRQKYGRWEEERRRFYHWN